MLETATESKSLLIASFVEFTIADHSREDELIVRIGMLSAAPCPPSTAEGVASYVYNLACKFVESGHNVTVLTRGSLTPREEYVGTSGGLRILRLPYLPLYPFHVHLHGVFVNQSIRFLEHELDILHVHSPYVPAIKTSLPLLTTIHSLEKVDAAHYEAAGARRLVYKASAAVFSTLERRLFEESDSLTTVSSHIFRELRDFYGLSCRGTVVGNGVNEREFKPINGKDPKHAPYVLYVGRIDYRKGLFDLINCAKLVCKDLPDISFALIGNGPLMGIVSKELMKNNLERNVVFHGYVSKKELIKLYQNCSVFVQPSHYEGLPTTMLEAMSCGAPVVATSIGGTTDVIDHGVNGFLIPVKSPAKMAESVLTLLSDDSLQRKVGESARHTIEHRYTWDSIAQGIFECYEELLRKPLARTTVS